MMFECKKCGACCKNLHLSDIYADLDRGDGICKHLKNNLCSIYENRPLKCRIDESYYVFFSEKMTIETYYKLNYEACEILIKKLEEK